MLNVELLSLFTVLRESGGHTSNWLVTITIHQIFFCAHVVGFKMSRDLIGFS